MLTSEQRGTEAGGIHYIPYLSDKKTTDGLGRNGPERCSLRLECGQSLLQRHEGAGLWLCCSSETQRDRKPSLFWMVLGHRSFAFTNSFRAAEIVKLSGRLHWP